MATHYMRDASGQIETIVTMADIYQFKGFTFSFHPYLGPMKLNKDFDESKRTGRTFWKAFSEWDKLSKKRKAKTQIAG